MRRSVRVGLAVLGAATTVYGFASLTGRWLGTPPWWERGMTDEEVLAKCIASGGGSESVAEYRRLHGDPTLPNYGTREWVSLATVATGLTVLALGAWVLSSAPDP